MRSRTSERTSEQKRECSAAHDLSEQCGASERVICTSKRVIGRASGPVHVESKPFHRRSLYLSAFGFCSPQSRDTLGAAIKMSKSRKQNIAQFEEDREKIGEDYRTFPFVNNVKRYSLSQPFTLLRTTPLPIL